MDLLKVIPERVLLLSYVNLTVGLSSLFSVPLYSTTFLHANSLQPSVERTHCYVSKS